MSPDRPLDSEYRRTMLAIAGEESQALNAHSKDLRAHAAAAVQGSRRLREQCATLSERIAAVLRRLKPIVPVEPDHLLDRDGIIDRADRAVRRSQELRQVSGEFRRERQDARKMAKRLTTAQSR